MNVWKHEESQFVLGFPWTWNLWFYFFLAWFFFNWLRARWVTDFRINSSQSQFLHFLAFLINCCYCLDPIPILLINGLRYISIVMDMVLFWACHQAKPTTVYWWFIDFTSTSILPPYRWVSGLSHHARGLKAFDVSPLHCAKLDWLC